MRLVEHANSLGDGSGRHLPVHCGKYVQGCKQGIWQYQGVGASQERSWRHLEWLDAGLMGASATHLCIFAAKSAISLLLDRSIETCHVCHCTCA